MEGWESRANKTHQDLDWMIASSAIIRGWIRPQARSSATKPRCFLPPAVEGFHSAHPSNKPTLHRCPESPTRTFFSQSKMPNLGHPKTRYQTYMIYKFIDCHYYSIKPVLARVVARSQRIPQMRYSLQNLNQMTPYKLQGHVHKWFGTQNHTIRAQLVVLCRKERSMSELYIFSDNVFPTTEPKQKDTSSVQLRCPIDVLGTGSLDEIGSNT